FCTSAVMQVTWWIPDMLAGTNRLLPTGRTEGESMLAPTVLTAPALLPGRRLRVDPAPDLGGQRLLQLLLDVGDEPDGARHHSQPPCHLPRDVELAGDGADGARSVDRQLASMTALRLHRDPLHQLHVPAGEAVLGGEREELWGPRVDRLVDRVAKACDRPLPLLMGGDDLPRQFVQVHARDRSGQRFLQGARGLFDRAAKAAADAQQPRCHGSLQRLGGAEVG